PTIAPPPTRRHLNFHAQLAAPPHNEVRYMRTARTALTALLLAGALSVAAAAQPPAPARMQPALNAAVAVSVGASFRGPVGVDFFYSNLAPYGYWVDRPAYGWVWVPRHVRHHWRPYSYGRWVYSDYGWTWASNEPFGWA